MGKAKYTLTISIHAAREGGDAGTEPAWQDAEIFQSTPPVKAATVFCTRCRPLWSISIHAAREGGDIAYRYGRIIRLISIHAAREGGDTRWWILSLLLMIFQSTPPVKAATYCGNNAVNYLRFQSTPPVKAAT